MRDYAREDAGAQVVMASCVDERFPPENMLDGKDGTFWLTTGLYPQEFVLKLDGVVQVNKITTLSLNVKKLSLERCDQDRPESFERVFEIELTNRGDRLQTEPHNVNFKARYLRFSILSGHAEFAAVNRVSVVGESLSGGRSGDGVGTGAPSVVRQASFQANNGGVGRPDSGGGDTNADF